MKTVLPHTARQFARAIIMPNLKPPVTSVEQALAYRLEILHALPEEADFTPLMTLYLTAAMTADEIRKAADCEHVYAVKLYPAGATTHSDAGVDDIRSIYPLLAEMEKYDLPLLIHGETTDPDCDIFDRERVFIDTTLSDIVGHFPGLRIVLEHVTTRDAVDFVLAAGKQVAATITPQHLMFNRNVILAGGIRPHYYCLPVIKRECHRQALVQAATGDSGKFFLGTDSAPHLTSMKESACGCAGCFSAHAAIELYAEVFEQAGALDRLEGFASFHGADFYRLPRNRSMITLEKKNWIIPDCYRGPDNVEITPVKAGETLSWRLVSKVIRQSGRQ